MAKPLDDLFVKEAQGDDKPSGASPFKPKYPGATPASLAAYGGLSSLVGPTTASVVGPGVEKLLSPKSDESIERETVQELFDPSHEAEMQRIRTQAMLSEFMTTDPVISTYDPDEITTAYNHISQLAPRASLQPALMRGLMRKLLQQQDTLEAFDVDQLVKIEKGLKDVETPTERPVSPYTQPWPTPKGDKGR
jgi:hypothetical protein